SSGPRDDRFQPRRIVARAKPVAKRKQPADYDAGNRKNNNGQYHTLQNFRLGHSHLSWSVELMAAGTLTSRIGRSTSLGRAGASRPSVSKKPLRAIEFAHKVCRFAM